MAKVRTNNNDGDFYTRNNTTVVQKGTPEKRTLYNEPGTVQRKKEGGVEFKPDGTEDKTKSGQRIDPKSGKTEAEGQASLIKGGQDVYKGADLGKEGHKKGDILSVDSKGKKLAIGRVGESVTPATPEETRTNKQVSITHKGDIQSSNGYPLKGKDLESKGYVNKGGAYSYEKPKKQVWVDEDKSEQYLKDNPDAQMSGGSEQTQKGRAQADTAKQMVETKKAKPAVRYAGRK